MSSYIPPHKRKINASKSTSRKNIFNDNWVLEAQSSNKNISLTISSAKPPIFWKDKETTKQQVLIWTPEEMKKTIFELNNLELVIKKNFDNSLNLTTDFILNLATTKANN